MPQVYARVRLDNGSEVTVTAHLAAVRGLKTLDKPAVGRDGRPLPPKHRVPLGTASAAKSRKSPAVKPAADESQED